MTAITDDLPLSYLDALTIALADIAQQNEELRNRFGGRTLAGTASIASGSLNLVGTGTSWLTGADDSLAPGDTLVLGDQLANVASVTGEGAIGLEPTQLPATGVGHIEGLVDREIHKAATWGRVHFPFEPVGLSMPYWVVSAGPQSPHGVAPNARRTSSPELQWTAVYEQGADANVLEHGQASWAALPALLEAVVQLPENQNLQVARFDLDVGGTDIRIPLVRQLLSTAPELVRDQDSHITFAALILTFEGQDPTKIRPTRW